MSDTQAHTARYKLVTSASEKAPWLVLVHGVSQDHRVFDKQVEHFKSEYRLCLIDLPGHGLSSDLSGPYGVNEYAFSILNSLQDADISKSHFWGTHIGAAAGLLLACEVPDVFQSLILESPVYPGRAIASVSQILPRVSEALKTQGLDAAREIWWHDGGWFDVIRNNPETCRAKEQRSMVDEFGGQPWLDPGLLARPIPPIDKKLAELSVPVLIMNGEFDLQDFVEAANDLGALIPNCEHATIAKGGGFPLWEFPDQVNKVASAFLRKP